MTQGYIKPNERLVRLGIKITRHLKKGLFEFLRYTKRNKRDAAYLTKNYLGRKNKAITLSILACQPGQSFSMGPDIQIVVLGSSKGIVRLGIEAPPEIKISREGIRTEGANDE